LAAPDPAAGALQDDPETTQAIQTALTNVINEATIRYIPLNTITTKTCWKS